MLNDPLPAARGASYENPHWHGIFPAINTKNRADKSIDAGGTDKHTDFQIRNGIHGSVTGGLLGEVREANCVVQSYCTFRPWAHATEVTIPSASMWQRALCHRLRFIGRQTQ